MTLDYETLHRYCQKRLESLASYMLAKDVEDEFTVGGHAGVQDLLDFIEEHPFSSAEVLRWLARNQQECYRDDSDRAHGFLSEIDAVTLFFDIRIAS